MYPKMESSDNKDIFNKQYFTDRCIDDRYTLLEQK